jgi:hypothetical protein
MRTVRDDSPHVRAWLDFSDKGPDDLTSLSPPPMPKPLLFPRHRLLAIENPQLETWRP